MLKNNQGLILEITDGDALCYRGNFFLTSKTTVMRLAHNMATELRSSYKPIMGLENINAKK